MVFKEHSSGSSRSGPRCAVQVSGMRTEGTHGCAVPVGVPATAGTAPERLALQVPPRHWLAWLPLTLQKHKEKLRSLGFFSCFIYIYLFI